MGDIKSGPIEIQRTLQAVNSTLMKRVASIHLNGANPSETIGLTSARIENPVQDSALQLMVAVVSSVIFSYQDCSNVNVK